MKRIALSVCLVFLSIAAIAQKTVTLPSYGATNVKELTIEKITLSDTATTVYFSAQYWPGTWFRISSTSYIAAGDNKLVAKSISGMQFDQQFTPENGKASFTMTFPAIDAYLSKIDFIEGDCDNCFKILDIELSPVKKQDIIPRAITGNWFKADGSGQWLLGLYENKAVYDSKIWEYGQVKTTGNIIHIKLQNGNITRDIYVKSDAAGLYAETTKKTMQLLSTKPVSKYTADNTEFTLPVIKSDTAYYNGYIKGYSSKFGYKTGQIYVNNVITGSQEAYLISINPDGSFWAKLPMYNPQECFVRIPSFNSSVFLEPGKHLFQYIDLTKNSLPIAYMGDNARLNYELDATRFMTVFDYDKVFENNPELDPTIMKKAILDGLAKKLSDLDKYNAENILSRKGYELDVMNINYRAAEVLLQVNFIRENAYRKAHNLPMSQHTAAIPPVKFDSAYLSFLNNIDVSNELALVSVEYGNFINNLKYIDPTLEEARKANLQLFSDELKKKSVLTADEKEAMKVLDTAENSADIQTINSAFDKCKTVINNLVADHKQYFIAQYAVLMSHARNKVLDALIHKDISFAKELMNVQSQAQNVEHNYIPLTNEQLAALKPAYKYIYLYRALIDYNSKMKYKIAANAKMGGNAANENPKTPADSAFANIIKKYKGKTIYVDFWATWCGPCRMGIETIAPIKEEMKNDNVIFLYITDQSSPIDTYNNMIKTIKGEHYRVSSDVWNILINKFNIDGIPHYALINKSGAVVDANALRPEEGDFKTKLLKLANN